ncbi:hypothetical protein [Streptomyces lydicus]|uniref:hypothetical protein n=1 Tax=Streptomyces lydicus TaxID=47763 RepID=UPI0036E5D73C
MNAAGLLTADEPETVDPLLDVVNGLLHEVCVFGRMCRLWGDMDDDATDQKARTRYYLDRRQMGLLQVTAALEDTIGLRFKDTAHLPYRHIDATWPSGQPLAGYASTPPGVSPFSWLLDFFTHWNMLLDDEFAEDGHFLRVLRSALWICNTSGLHAAVNYVADLVETGQVVNTEAAAKAASFLLIAGSRTASPQELVASITEGRLPQNRQQWLVFCPTLEDPQGVRLSKEASAAVESLVTRGRHLVEQAHAATTLDEWLSTLAALEGVLKLVQMTVYWVVESPSVALQSILSQFEETRCDIAAAWVDMELGSGRDAGIPGFQDFQRGVEETFVNEGDTSGQRFRRERLLLPPDIYASPVDSLSSDWSEPSWRIAVAWEACHSWAPISTTGPLPPDRGPDTIEHRPLRGSHLRKSLALHPERPQHWQALGSELRAAGWLRAAEGAFAVVTHMLRPPTTD